MNFVYLIGGPTGVGRSTLALELSMDPDLHVSSIIGTDSLREVLRRIIPGDTCPPLFYSSYDGHKSLEDGWEPCDFHRSDPLICAYDEQARIISIAVAAVIERSFIEGINLIIEGVHISPHHIRKLLKPEIIDQIVEAVLDIENEDLHRQRITERQLHAPLRDVSRHLQYFGNIRHVRHHIVKVAKDYHIPIIQNVDEKNAAEQCRRILSENLGSRK